MKKSILTKDELRIIRGGKSATASEVAAQGFPCRVVESDGSEKIVMVETIQECLDIAYP